jgi:hypothetical protein
VDARPGAGIDFTKIVHGEELVVVHKPLSAAGTVVSKHRITRIVDKGAGKGATVTYDKELFDKASGEKLATVTHTTFCRGDGGFSAGDGATDASPPSPPKVPQREPDLACELRTLPQQALLYRLCADRNPCIRSRRLRARPDSTGRSCMGWAPTVSPVMRCSPACATTSRAG